MAGEQPSPAGDGLAERLRAALGAITMEDSDGRRPKANYAFWGTQPVAQFNEQPGSTVRFFRRGYLMWKCSIAQQEHCCCRLCRRCRYCCPPLLPRPSPSQPPAFAAARLLMGPSTSPRRWPMCARSPTACRKSELPAPGALARHDLRLSAAAQPTRTPSATDHL